MSTPDERFSPGDLDAWRARAQRELGDRDPSALRWRADDLELAPLYTEADLPDLGEPCLPGAPPFLRGSAPRHSWSVVHEPAGDLRAAAARALREGADAIWLTPSACAELARPADLAPFFELGAPLFLEAGSRAPAMAGAYVASGANASLLFDPLGVLASEGLLATSIERAFTHLGELFARAPADARLLLVSARPYHEAGAGAVYEVALALATGFEYLRRASEAGHPLADTPRRMLFSFALDSDFFVGIAKLRAARLCWSKVLRTLGIDGPEQGMRIHARSSVRAASLLETHVNVLRSSAEAFAAALGGAELVCVAPHDELTDAGPHAARLARNTQLVLREEGQLGRVLDPAGGSYFIESLTDAIARRAWAELQEIDHLGGVFRGLRDGSIAERLERCRAARASAIATRARVMIGVNRYPSARVPEAIQKSKRARTSGEAPVEVKKAAREGSLIEALERAREVDFDLLHSALGDSEEAASAPPLVRVRDAEAFEKLRARTAALEEVDRSAIVLSVGDPRALEARLAFVREALEVCGMEVSVFEASAAADGIASLNVEARTAVLCAADGDYPALSEALASALRERGVRRVLAATRPSEALAVDGFLYHGADLVRLFAEDADSDREVSS